MTSLNGYGVVYTPETLANFTAKLLISETTFNIFDSKNNVTVLDPACGEGMLLKEFYREFRIHYNIPIDSVGVDIEEEVIHNNKKSYNDTYRFICKNTIIPSNKVTAISYWKHHMKAPSFIIANPPWSSEKIFSKSDLSRAGYEFYTGQYDSYVLFIELCLKLVKKGGILAFIIPDSLFSDENKKLREYLLKNTQIRVIARLGEKLFHNINRATSVIILKNSIPTVDSTTTCYRLDTTDRKKFLAGSLDIFDSYIQKKHSVLQKRFENNQNYVFDIDARREEEFLLKKIETNHIDWNKVFHFGRGVEISKSGIVVKCEHCQSVQGYSKKQLKLGRKVCQACGKITTVNKSNIFKIISTTNKTGYVPMYVGENLHRYSFDGIRYILPNVNGINYKSSKLYYPSKILIRKTGLGISACIDYESTYISQAIYSCNFIKKNNPVPLEYYLGVLNSRVMYYFYLKKYGENEWKSHPYLTKNIIFSLPIREVNDSNLEVCQKIAKLAQKIQKKYSRELDLEIEKLVLKLYDINQEECDIIMNVLNNLPDLNAFNHMKISIGELYV